MAETITLHYTEEQIAGTLRNLAARLNNHYNGRLEVPSRPVVALIVLKGAFMFGSDLVKLLDFPIEIDFIRASSYKGTESTGKVEITTLGHLNVKDKDVLIIDDIYDTGLSMEELVKYVSRHQSHEITTCTFLVHPERTNGVDFYAMVNHGEPFVVGYGMDYNEQYRSVGYLGILSFEHKHKQLIVEWASNTGKKVEWKNAASEWIYVEKPLWLETDEYRIVN